VSPGFAGLPAALRPALAALALAVAGCGPAARPATCRPAATPTPPQASAAALTASADRAVVGPGGSVTFTVVARGPVAFRAGCDAPLQVVVDDSTQLSVYAGAAHPGPHSPCGAVSLAAGATAVYNTAWPVDPHLPAGTYRATLALGDLPALMLPVRVGVLQAPC
jgi:hypothetical protein